MRSSALLVVVLAGAACSSGGGGAAPAPDGGQAGAGVLTVTSADQTRGIVGSYAGSYATQSRTVSFSSTIEPGSGKAIARLSSGGVSVDVTLTPAGEGVMQWRGFQYTGNGPIPAEATSALTELGSGPLGPGLALVPLELACKVDARETDLQRAALVMPWQILAKYDPKFPGAATFEAMSACKYFTPASQNASRKVPQGLQLSNSDQVPHVFGIFPLDAAGAAAKLVPLAHNTRPCVAMCPGTCGPDCPSPPCTTRDDWVCVQVAGLNTGVARPRTTWTCSTHMGCRWHDQCYDDCNSASGCGSWSAAFCRRGCDRDGVSMYGYSNAYNWVHGMGPFDGMLTYTHEFPERDRQDPAMCPPGRDASADVVAQITDGPRDAAAPDAPPDRAPDLQPDRTPDRTPDVMVCPTYTATVGFCAGENMCPAGGSPCPGTSCIPGFCFTRLIAGCTQEKCPPMAYRNYTNYCMCPMGMSSTYDPCRAGFLVSCGP